VGKGVEEGDLGVVEAAHGAGHLQKTPTGEEGVKVTGRETTPLAQGDGRQRTSSGAMASSMSGRRSSSTSMPVVAMSSTVPWAAYGQECLPWEKDRCAWLAFLSLNSVPRTPGSRLAAP